MTLKGDVVSTADGNVVVQVRGTNSVGVHASGTVTVSI